MAGLVHRLAEPLVLAGEAVTEVRLRAPNAGDYFRVYSKGLQPWEETLEMIVNLSQRTRDELGALDSRDYFALVELIRPFSFPRRATSSDASPTPSPT